MTPLPVLVEEAVARLRRLNAGEEPYSANWATAIAEDTGMTPVEFDEETIAKWFVSHGANELLAANNRTTTAEAKLRAAEERASRAEAQLKGVRLAMRDGEFQYTGPLSPEQAFDAVCRGTLEAVDKLSPSQPAVAKEGA